MEAQTGEIAEMEAQKGEIAEMEAQKRKIGKEAQRDRNSKEGGTYMKGRNEK